MQKEVFDVNQRHGNHIDCVNGYAESGQFLSEWLPLTVREGTLALASKTPVACSLGGGIPPEAC